MEYQSTAKYIRVSTRKVRLVAGTLRGSNVSAALASLAELPKRAALPLSRAITAAAANAKQKQVGLTPESLSVKAIEVMGGPVMKRFHPVSRGMAHSYKKRMTHIRVVLTDERKEEERV